MISSGGRWERDVLQPSPHALRALWGPVMGKNVGGGLKVALFPHGRGKKHPLPVADKDKERNFPSDRHCSVNVRGTRL